MVGRAIRLNQHPFTILGIAPPGFQGTLWFLGPDFFVPIVDQEQLGGASLDLRTTEDGVFAVLGHLKPGVTPAQAVADAEVVGTYLEKTYPRQFAHKSTVLARGGLTSFGPAVRAFVAGLMLLAGLILLAACANLGSLFAARASDRSREVALRLALGSSRVRILRQLFTEAGLLSLAGGALGCLAASCAVAEAQHMGAHIWSSNPHACNSGRQTVLVRVALGVDKRLIVWNCTGATNPQGQSLWRSSKPAPAGAGPDAGSPAAMCCLAPRSPSVPSLFTSSIVAVRGLARSLHTKFGFEPRGTMTAAVNLSTVGYSIDRIPAMQRRMIDAMEAIPGVQAVGLVNNRPPLVYTAGDRANVFREETSDFKPSNAAIAPLSDGVSPGYFSMQRARPYWRAGICPGRTIRMPPLLRSSIGSSRTKDCLVRSPGAIGRYYKLQDGTRVEVIGVVEDGKYITLTEDQQPAMFLSCGRSPTHLAYLVVRSTRDPEELAAAMRKKVRELEAGLPVETHTWSNLLEVVLFPSRIATMALGVMGGMGAILSITGIFGMTAYTVSKRMRELGIRIALGAQRKEVLKAALGRAFKLLAIGSGAGLILGILASRVLAFIVYQATPRDPLVLAGVVLAMLLLGLLATWIPAQRALSVDPVLLLREE